MPWMCPIFYKKKYAHGCTPFLQNIEIMPMDVPHFLEKHKNYAHGCTPFLQKYKNYTHWCTPFLQNIEIMPMDVPHFYKKET